ncbi:MAG: hypothetical protein QOK07_3058 [Gemmatimonadaceae bacterium]|nr:hypothetical protein [Gemmatimonadaceae bacterium]
MRLISTLCAVVLVIPMVGVAQMSQPDILRVDTGSRVRIAAPVFGSKKQVGTVVSLTRDTLVLRQGANTSFQSVATSDITALEVSSGKHTNKAKGALWGLLVGAGGGAILGYTLYKEPSCQTQGGGCFIIIGPDSKGSNAAFSAVAGGVFGILAGTLFGMHASETWVPGTVGAR